MIVFRRASSALLVIAAALLNGPAARADDRLNANATSVAATGRLVTMGPVSPAASLAQAEGRP